MEEAARGTVAASVGESSTAAAAITAMKIAMTVTARVSKNE